MHLYSLTFTFKPPTLLLPPLYFLPNFSCFWKFSYTSCFPSCLTQGFSLEFFLFLLAKAARAYLLAAHYGRPKCPSFSDEACTILYALGWLRQYQQNCHCSSSPFQLSLCPHHSASPLSFFLPQSLEGTVFSLLLCYQDTMVPRSFFSLEMTRLMSWPE